MNPEPNYLRDYGELLFRQIHPHFFFGEKLASSAFIPTNKDHGMLSVFRERLGAEGAYKFWLAQGGQSIGTYAVSVGEVSGLDLNAPDDATAENPHHAAIDFSSCRSRGQMRQLGRKLRDLAEGRGRLFP